MVIAYRDKKVVRGVFCAFFMRRFIDTALQSGVEKFIFLGSSCIYQN
jgi:hypothetical protein